MQQRVKRKMVVFQNEQHNFQLQEKSFEKDTKNNSGNNALEQPNTNIIYHQKKMRRKSSLSALDSLEVQRIRNQDQNLLNRPAWTDAKIALMQIKKVGNASGKQSLFLCRKNVEYIFDPPF